MAKKNITKEQAVMAALDLLQDKGEVRGVNLREIAHVLGCAHTNLYHYFPSLGALLWAVHTEVQKRFTAEVARELEAAGDGRDRLRRFFFALAALYVDHEGWFRLLWLAPMEGPAPEEDKAATGEAVDAMVEALEGICLAMAPPAPARERIHSVLHDVHCYMVGEVSNFISGRGLIRDARQLKDHIAQTAAAFFILALREE